ncbi:hypothetical protein JTB14_020344 [Gonioctena quinquepunctata]|nr:hypothetical protein JTB14_020344 [Gonioctena quinquepunctata]
MLKKQEHFEQSLRSKSLRIYGVKEKREENSFQSVLHMFNEKMKLNLNESDVESCYTIGKFGIDSNRPIIFKFYSRYHEHLAYNNKKILKKTGFIIREDLNPDQFKLLKAVVSEVGVSGKEERIMEQFSSSFLLEKLTVN